MKKVLFALAVCVITLGASSGIALAKAQSVTYGGHTYYVVTSTDPNMNTGNKVCKSMGKQCVGYTAKTTDVCKMVHKDAKIASDMNGSSAGFYCDGSPQGGVCASEKNTCHICKNCNVNADCDTQIGDLYREMYVQCSPDDAPAEAPSNQNAGRWWGSFNSFVAHAFDLFRQKLAVLNFSKLEKHAKIQVKGPNGETVDADIPVDSLVCEFYQKNKKLVTCGALAAADQFCVQAFDSRFAKAELCQDNGLIICSKPCTTNPQEVKPQRCAFDGDRPRGNQAPPLDFCTETKTINVPTVPTKKAGQECKHGGECNTGYCLGQPSDSGIKYFCSCKQTTLDFTCGK